MDVADDARVELEALTRDQAGAVDLKADDISKLWLVVLETEGSLIPDGPHIVGRPMGDVARAEMCKLMTIADPVARKAADRLLAEDHAHRPQYPRVCPVPHAHRLCAAGRDQTGRTAD